MELLTRYRDALAQEMRSLLEGPPSPLLTMCRYHLGLSSSDGEPLEGPAGKMLRPALCLALCDALGGDVPTCLPAALSLELLHRTSLVLDDVQDHSTERNDRPTVWGVWGVEHALNAGLVLSSHARLALHGMLDRGASPELVLRLHRVLERTAMDPCHGQYLDLAYRSGWLSLPGYREMARLKTGALLGASCRVAALTAGRDDLESPALLFGEALGVAFQYRDDILGAWGDEAILGKAPDDLEEGRRTLPVALAVEASPTLPGDIAELRRLVDTPAIRERAEAEAGHAAEEALALLKGLCLSGAWESAFQGLIGFVLTRNV
ncbi:MAG: polyprenyl synthetase family protein [Deltaproteobacteria bacterium]|nr:polyprenyl synthetase family protein [Deltaproteobacteria bacterium]